MIDFRKVVGYCDTKYPSLDETTPWYEFNSYCECCRSLGMKPSVQRFMRYQNYYKTYGSNKKSPQFN